MSVSACSAATVAAHLMFAIGPPRSDDLELRNGHFEHQRTHPIAPTQTAEIGVAQGTLRPKNAQGDRPSTEPCPIHAVDVSERLTTVEREPERMELEAVLRAVVAAQRLERDNEPEGRV